MKNLALIILTMTGLIGCTQKPKSESNSEAHATEQKEFKPHVKVLKEEGHNLISEEAEVEVIAEGFNWTEGPVYVADGDYLLFSDVPENKVHKWKEGEGVSEFLNPAGYTGAMKSEKKSGSNGLTLSNDGKLVLCQQGDRRIGVLQTSLNEPEPVYATLFDSYQGKRFNSPNDLIFNENGDLYITDPTYGLDFNLRMGLDDPARELDIQGVYQCTANGEVNLISDKLKFPNGIALSPDEKTLYVAQSDPENIIWMAYELDENGLAQSERIFYDANDYQGVNKGLPDGMKVASTGYIYATGPEGVWIFNPKGEVLAKVFTGQHTANCALSTDEKYLYICADDYIMRVRLKG
ncbi:MAG: SMP-30/gluconolactonase/LRE family protein [Cyclobacteriaceae bacterium]